MNHDTHATNPSGDWISVPNPVDTFGMPIFEGHAHDAPNTLIPGVYAATTDTDEPCELVVTDADARVLRTTTESPTGTTFSLDGLAAALHALKFEATVEHTGGNTATLYAGTRRPDGTWPVVAGPGAWTPHGSTADLADFHVGPDDTDAEPTWSSTADDTIGDVLMTITAHIISARLGRP